MSIFAGLTPQPPDAILGLVEEYNRDPRPGKVSLAAGVFVDESGITPVLATVAEAEARILAAQTTKLYKPVAGDPAYLRPVRDLVFGAGNATVAEGRVETLHTPGGTGALRVAADLVYRLRPGATVWMSTPTWPNHPQVFAAAGLKTGSYPYLDASTGALDSSGMLAALRAAPAGDVVLLHACCHNPTGIDPTPDVWRQIGDVIAERGLLPLVDFAYQGFGDGLEADAGGLLELVRPGSELLVASSFSKNFSLYDERVGALSLVAASRDEAVTLLSHARVAVRANYSSPPAHGGEVVATILADAALRARWVDEVTAMRTRISGNRRLFVDGLREAGAPDFSRLLQQKGMFSLLGLSAEQVRRLKEDHAVYVVGGGRVNVAGITQRNLEPACRAIAAVLAD
jgi:aspartate aminotransferase